MTLPLHTDTAMVPFTLPEDPNPGQVIVLPQGQVAGGTSVLSLYVKRQLVGSIVRLVPIPNVTRMYRAERATSSISIAQNTLIRIKAVQYSFTEVTFFQNFGWVGTNTIDDNSNLVLSDKYYKVLHAILVGPTAKNTFLYEQLCLRAVIIDKPKE